MFLLRVYNAIKPVKTFCQVFKVEICKANTTVTWQVVVPQPIPRNNLFRGFFMPEYRFLQQHLGVFLCLKIFWEPLRDFSKTSLYYYTSISKRGLEAIKRPSPLFDFNLICSLKPQLKRFYICHLARIIRIIQIIQELRCIIIPVVILLSQKNLFPCYAAFVALAPVPHSVKYRLEALA